MSPITAKEEFSKNPELKMENITYLRDWISKQPHLPDGITDEQLILFLHCCQHSLENCKHTIEAYYTIRTHAPDLFGNRDDQLPEIMQSLSIIQYATMPTRDQYGNVVMIGRIVDLNPTKFTYVDSVKIWFMIQDAILLELGTVPGFVFLIDTKGCTVGHLARINISVVKKYCMYIQDAFPGNVVATHLVNASSITESMASLFRAFFNSDMLKKLFVHTSMDTLYEHVTKDALPKEYGGNLDSLEIYRKETVVLFNQYRDWFRTEEAFRVDEKKRPGKAKQVGEIFGIEGSFKKLDID